VGVEQVDQLQQGVLQGDQPITVLVQLGAMGVGRRSHSVVAATWLVPALGALPPILLTERVAGLANQT
jgi:hypothetical protein